MKPKALYNLLKKPNYNLQLTLWLSHVSIFHVFLLYFIVRSNYLIYIIAGSCGGVIILCIAIITIICCIRVQNKKGNCPKPCGKWEVEIDETNAGPLSLAMKQRNRKAPITVPFVSEDDPPPYDLTNAPPLSTDPNKPPEYDPEEFGQQHSPTFW